MESAQRYTQFDIDALRSNKRQRETQVTSKPRAKQDKKKRCIQGPLKTLTLPNANTFEDESTEILIQHESPWNTFESVYRCDLAGEFDIVMNRYSPYRMVAMRQTSGGKVQRTMKVLQTASHKHILSAETCFLFNDSLFYIHEDMPITLENIVSCNIQMSDKELGVIFSQV